MLHGLFVVTCFLQQCLQVTELPLNNLQSLFFFFFLSHLLIVSAWNWWETILVVKPLQAVTSERKNVLKTFFPINVFIQASSYTGKAVTVKVNVALGCRCISRCCEFLGSLFRHVSFLVVFAKCVGARSECVLQLVQEARPLQLPRLSDA